MFLNIAGYKFEPLDGLDSLIPSFQNKCDELDLRGSIYLSPNGINFSIAGTEEAIESYLEFMEEDERFLNIPLKRTYSATKPFRRMKVRLKKRDHFFRKRGHKSKRVNRRVHFTTRVVCNVRK